MQRRTFWNPRAGKIWLASTILARPAKIIVAHQRLEKLAENDEKEYVNAWADYIRTTLKAETAPLAATYAGLNEIVPYLVDDVEKKLVALPDGLRAQINYFETKHADIYTIFTKSAKDRTDEEKAVVAAFESAYSYEKFSRARKKWGAYHLVAAYKPRMCPYCHGSHINYHGAGDGRMRPALDHFYPESKYPYLAISLYNLIPSCYQCNSSIKRSEDPYERSAPHPFEFVETDVTFSLNPTLSRTSSVLDEVLIKIHSTTPAAAAHLKLFALQERYQWYAPEISDVCERTRKWLDAKGPLHDLVTREAYACGFEQSKGRSRILGRCLLEVSAQVSKLTSS